MENLTLFEVYESSFEERPVQALTLRDETNHLIINNSKNSLLYMRYPLVLDFINKYKIFYVSELKEMLTIEEIPISNRVLSLLLKALVFDNLLIVKFIKSGFHKKRQVYWLKGEEEEANKQIVFFESQFEQSKALCDHGIRADKCYHCLLEKELGTKLTLAQFEEISLKRGQEKMKIYNAKYSIRT